MHDEEGVDEARLLDVVGHDAADEGGLRRHQHVDQVVQLVLRVEVSGITIVIQNKLKVIP